MRSFLAAILLLTVGAAGQAAAAAQAPPAAILVTAARLIDPRSGSALSPAAVLIENGKVRLAGASRGRRSRHSQGRRSRQRYAAPRAHRRPHPSAPGQVIRNDL